MYQQEQQPMVMGQQQQMVGQQPMVEGGQPMVMGQQQQMVGQQPMVGGGQPMVVGQPQPVMVMGGPGGGRMWVSPVIQELPPGCPPGLEFLLPVDTLFVKQQVELLEALTGFETANRYDVLNIHGQRLFLAMEQSGCCERQMCGALRGFDMALLNSVNQEVMHFTRAFQCCNCCGCCCRQEVKVFAPPGHLIGSVEQECQCWKTRLAIKDGAGQKVMGILGPCCVCDCIEDEFKLLGADGTTKLGRVSKQWSGFLKELFTDADNFGISFPMDLDVKLKATVLAACILIDFMHYENNNNDQNGLM